MNWREIREASRLARPLALLSGVLAALAVCGCGNGGDGGTGPAMPSAVAGSPAGPAGPVSPRAASARCAFSRPSGRMLVFRGDPGGCLIHVTVRSVIVLDFAPVRAAGRLRRLQPAGSLNTAVLHPVAVPVGARCPDRDTCTAFLALTAGSSGLTWSSPSGCQPGGECVQAAQAVLRVIVK